MDIIRSVRNIRAEVDAPMSKQIRIFINAKSEEVLENLSTNQAYLKRFCNPSELVIEKDLTVEEETMTAVVTGADIFLPTEGLIDVSAEIERLNNELKKLAAEALTQIEDKKYDTELRKQNIKTIYKYGIAFSGKKVEIITN